MIDWQDKPWREQALEIRACTDALKAYVPKDDVAGQAVLFQAREMLLWLCQQAAGVDLGRVRTPISVEYPHIIQSIRAKSLSNATVNWIAQHPDTLAVMLPELKAVPPRKITAIKALRTSAQILMLEVKRKLVDEGLLDKQHMTDPPISMGLRDAKDIADALEAKLAT